VRDLATSVVMTLMEGHLDAGRTLSTDNFYTSVPLAETLLGRKTHLVGTVRKNRKGLPPGCVSAAELKSLPKPISSTHPPPPVYRVHQHNVSCSQSTTYESYHCHKLELK